MHGFQKKRRFPNDWTCLSEEQSIENIKYLLENHKKYSVTFQNDNKVLIDNVLICQEKVNILRYTYYVYVINNRMFTMDGFVGKCISQLINQCKHTPDNKTLVEKLEQFVKQHKLDIYFLLFAMCLAIACFKVSRVNEKSEQKKEEYQEQSKKIVNAKKCLNGLQNIKTK